MTTHGAGAAAARQLCDAFVARDWERVRSAIGDGIVFGVGGSSPFAGVYEGRDAFVGLVQRMVEESLDTLRFSAGADSYDVLNSDAHIAILVPFSAEREGRTLDYSYQVWQFHNSDQLDGYSGIYVADQAAFDDFWS